MDSQAGRLSSTNILPAYLTFRIAPGDYIVAVEAEIQRFLKEAQGNRLKAINLAFEQMHASGQITDHDLKRLEKVSLAIVGVEQGKHAANEAVAKLDKLYVEAVADSNSSSMGTTMIGVSYSARSNKTASAAGLMGMVIGGMITQGPWGALVGGLVGWVAGGGCKEED